MKWLVRHKYRSFLLIVLMIPFFVAGRELAYINRAVEFLANGIELVIWSGILVVFCHDSASFNTRFRWLLIIAGAYMLLLTFALIFVNGSGGFVLG
jgi:hypothetical protein